MTWFQRLFGSAPPPPKAVIFESGTSDEQQATCLRRDGAYIIDLRSLPADHARVIRAIKELAERIEIKPEPYQVWVMSTRILEQFSESTDRLMDMTDALFAATKHVEPRLIVEEDAPENVVYILRSLGFHVHQPGLKLTVVDDFGKMTEVDVLGELEKIRQAPRIRV